MKKTTSLAFVFFLLKSFLKINSNRSIIKNRSIVILVLVLFSSYNVFAQLAVPFSPRLSGGNIKVKGDVVLIGNSIITAEGVSLPFNDSGNNNGRVGEYINVASGGDPSIFSSSTADLAINNSCKNIVFAGLYWASVYPNEVGTNSGQQFEGTPRIEDWNQIKFKLPTDTNFRDLVADNDPDPTGEEDDIIFDGYDPVNINNSFKDSPIICYKNVTNLLQGLAEADGTYTVANLRATRGSRDGGCAAGWTLVVIYESPLLPSKFISVFDGYAGVQGSTTLDIPVAGFQTLPAPLPVEAKIGVAALEGDLGINGDSFRFKASTSGTYTELSDALNSTDNFFNSKITNNGAYMNNRNPNSTNTLGFDIANVAVPNPLNSVLPNDATAGDLRLTTSGDGYGAFVASFAVDIIEPNVVLTKIVVDELGNNIGGAVVNLGQQLNYVIGFQNTGNDDATDFTIRDILPTNVIYNHPADLETLPTGVTVESYDATSREIIFRIDDSLVEEFGPVTEIRFSVRVVEFCNLLNDACSDNISNQAFATYRSKLNPSFIISDDPSYDINNGCLIAPQATNFLADLTDCNYTEEVILCGASTTLTASGGYDSYSWSTSPTGTPVIGTDQSISVTSTGTYYVHNIAIAPCQSIDKIFEVITFGANVDNPVLPYADQIVTCPNDGKQLPNIFLCGGAGGKFIQTNLSDSTSLIWERLDETSCDEVLDAKCANEDGDCIWNQVATGPNYMADTAGQFRLTVNYPGGCFNQFYFNVYSNVLTPTVNTNDIICNTQGEIVVGGVPSGYEYSIDGTNYQNSNTFTITTPDLYTVYIKQIGVSPNPCIFTVPDVQIRERNFTVSTIINQPLCHEDLGNIVIAVNDVEPQYFYSISKDGTLVNSVGPVIDRDYTFPNLSPGTYNIDISTEDGCVFTDDVEIIEPPLLEATSALTIPLTCVDGEITIYPVGGTPPYFYFVNGSTTFETVPTIPVTAGGTFDVEVVDSNNCSATTSIDVNPILEPDFDIFKTDVLCYGNNSGEIRFDVTNANGYVVEYSIDNGTTYVASSIFSNLIAGTYATRIKYSLNGVDCFSTPEDIIINEPAAAVTATAGVSELACGGRGRVRITNPQGGVEPYEYSFDNQATWTNINENYVAPGTYTLYVKDANGCIFPTTNVTVDPQPVEPTINVSEPEFNCDGSANSTVTITNTSSNAFAYTYLIDGVENPNTADPTTFLNVPNGSHTVSVIYELQTVPTFSELLNEDFGYGQTNVISEGVNTSTFQFEPQTTTGFSGANNRIENGEYSVTSEIVRPYGPWLANVTDHSSTTIPDGRFLVVNMTTLSLSTSNLYSKRINDIIPNQKIKVEMYLLNLLKVGTPIVPATNGFYNPNLTLALIDPATGNIVSSIDTGDIPPTDDWVKTDDSFELDPGAFTSLDLVVRNNKFETRGNDVAFDDIRIFQLPRTCTTRVDFPIVISAGNAFDASIVRTTGITCPGASDGAIEISVQNFNPVKGFQYSLDNGTTWITQLTSPHTITGLPEGNQNIQIRYEDAVDTCVENLSANVGAPIAVEVSVSNTDITCLDGATVTASGSNGTPPYRFELLSDSSVFISDFPNNGILPNIPEGDYIVKVIDANDCEDTAPLTLEDPTPPTATVNDDFCYDATSGASVIVTANDGHPPYQFNIDGNPFQNNNQFNGLAPGTYAINVRDSYGCTIAMPLEVIIEEQVSLNTTLTKKLDCTIAPNAIITGTVTNGYLPYVFEVSTDGGATYSSTDPELVVVSATSFTYSAATSGTYLFRVTDDNNCIVESTITINQTVISASSTTVDPTCNGYNDGSITITPTTGEGPFTFSNDGGTTFVSNNVFGGLTAGTYDYIVRDSRACETETPISVVLNDPAPIDPSINPNDMSCDSASNSVILGSIDVDITSGGTAPYTYRLYDNALTEIASYTTTSSPSSFSTRFANLDFGDYYITIIDANGCEYRSTEQRIEPRLYMQLVPTATATSCAGVSVTLEVTGGDDPYTYSIYDQPGTAFGPTNDTSHTFNMLDQNTEYTFQVIDSKNCPSYLTVTTDIISPIEISTLVANNITCNGFVDGEVSFTVDQFNTSVTELYYEVRDNLTNLPITPATNGNITGLPGASPSATITGLETGNYTLYVEEVDGTQCSAARQFQITESTIPLSASVTARVNANCNLPAQITVSAIGGTGPYRYAAEPAPYTLDTADFGTSNVLNLPYDPLNTTWDIVVRDANNCDFPLSETITLDPNPVISATLNDQCSPSESDYEIEIALTTVGKAPYSLTVGSVVYQPTSFPYTVSNLSSGSHTIELKDANGCLSNSENININAPLALSGSVTTLPSCSDDDGVITMTGSGGSGNYAFTINSSAASISYSGTGNSVISGVPAGTYTVTIEDTTTSCEKDTSVTVDAATPVTFTLNATPVSCNGFDDGTITVNLPTSNDNPIYTYSLDGGVTTQTSNVFTNLIAGDYDITVTSGRNCILTLPETVAGPNAITIPPPIVVDYACTLDTNTENFATITVNGVTGGSLNYTIYEFEKGGTVVQVSASNVYTESDLSGGNYTINVYDDKGCIGSTTADVQPFISLDSLDVTVDNIITCINDEDITVSVTSTGGTPTNLEYTVKSTVGSPTGNNYDQTNTNGIFTNLPIGNYLVTVLNLDTDCTLQTTHYVNEPNTFDLTVDNVVDVTCFSDPDGSVDVTFIDRSPTPIDESGLFEYDLFDNLGNPIITSGTAVNAGPITIPGLASGTYTITARLFNIPFCTISKNFTITAPTEALAISETHTEITCVTGNNDGTISAIATGGWPGDYEYQLTLSNGTIISTYSTAFNFTDLTAGDYIVSVRDSRDCIASTNVLLENPDPIDADINETPSLLSCFGDTNASITVSNVINGQGSNYTYTLNMVLPTPTSSGPQTSQVFNGLGAGTYNVTVRDGYNCEFITEDVVITEPTAIEATLVKATSQTCNNRATLTLSATGGTGLYEYSETINFTTVLGQFTSDITFEVDQGTYQYYVRDANACEPAISNEITIEPFIELDIDIDETNATINCTGDLTGVIVANATGGLGNYTYILQDEFDTDITPAPTQNSPGVFTELPAGIYQVRVTSGIDCEKTSLEVEISEPLNALQVSPPIITDVSCSGGNDGILEIVAMGGTGIIKYAISPQLNQFFDSPIFEGLSAGDYQAIAQDELGCYELIDFTITEPATVILSVDPDSIIPEPRADELDGSFSVNISGGTLPYSVSLDDINGTYTTGALTQTRFDFDDLAGGDHIVYVRDNLGCESEWNIPFPESVRINTALDIAYCTDNLSDASVNMLTVMVDETLVNLSDLDYSLDGATFQLENTFTNIPSGNHYVTVRHTNTCEVIVNFEMEQFDPLQLSIADGNINEIIASPSGGSGVYEYELRLENSSTSEFFTNTDTFIIYESGNYTVTVTDSNGCTAVATAFFEYIDVCIDNYFTPNNDNRQDEWGPGCTAQYPNMTVAIFDRYGRKVYDLKVGQTWDGTYKGKNLPSGDYWYVLKLNDQRDDREFVGHFTLYR